MRTERYLSVRICDRPARVDWWGVSKSSLSATNPEYRREHEYGTLRKEEGQVGSGAQAQGDNRIAICVPTVTYEAKNRPFGK